MKGLRHWYGWADSDRQTGSSTLTRTALGKRCSVILLGDFKRIKRQNPLALQVELLTEALLWSGALSYSFCKSSLILSWLCQWGLAMCLAPTPAWHRAVLLTFCQCVWIVRPRLLLEIASEWLKWFLRFHQSCISNIWLERTYSSGNLPCLTTL